MLQRASIGLLVLVAACNDGAVDPCPAGNEKPVLEIGAASNQATGASIPVIAITNITLDGAPVDTAVLRSNFRWNIARTSKGITCTVPCSFGREPGSYAFDARATGFYETTAHVVAQYSQIPSGCPAAHGKPAQVALAL
ncbi:MAG TPA: hypothetical protein VK864_12830, partial [Longimicrobiales bacterium]|nr:hypothetical protein [Longimicrobiales bacterium]